MHELKQICNLMLYSQNRSYKIKYDEHFLLENIQIKVFVAIVILSEYHDLEISRISLRNNLLNALINT